MPSIGPPCRQCTGNGMEENTVGVPQRTGRFVRMLLQRPPEHEAKYGSLDARKGRNAMKR